LSCRGRRRVAVRGRRRFNVIGETPSMDPPNAPVSGGGARSDPSSTAS
jgi:hypothetical protein